MILWIDEFDGAHVADELTPDIMQAVSDDVADVYRFDTTLGEYQKYDGVDWVTIEKE